MSNAIKQSAKEKHDIKRAVRKRDGNVCTQCGIDGRDYYAVCGRHLDVHRINPGSIYAVDDTCITLCFPCHKQAHGYDGRFTKSIKIDSRIHEALQAIAQDRGITVPECLDAYLRPIVEINYSIAVDMLIAEHEKDRASI